MKVDRRLREYRIVVENLCQKFGLRLPIRIELMKNWVNRPEISWGRLTMNHSTDEYYIKLRKMKMVEGRLVSRTSQEIKKSICHELAHLTHHEHTPRHQALTLEMYKEVEE